MKKSEKSLKTIVSHAKNYGFVFPSSDIYDGISVIYDYGHIGVLLKNNIKEYWWKAMVQLHENIVGIDTAILMNPTVWKASGHIEYFNDLLIDNKNSKRRYRADTLIEEHVEKLEQKLKKENEVMHHSHYIFKYKQYIISRLEKAIKKNNLIAIKELIDELNIKEPVTGSKHWTDVRKFNLMFTTKVGSLEENATTLYLRPETAQGSLINFSKLQKSARMKIPFGIAQIGKAFRNEIIARQFIFRMREFEQMEMQFFVPPNKEMRWYEYWKKKRLKWHLSLGLGEDKYRLNDHKKLSHYAHAATDIEFRFPFGFKEIEGIHSRTDFDLKTHEKYSKKNLKYFDHNYQCYLPYVVETSLGLDRMFLAVLASSFTEETIEDGKIRLLLRLPAVLAPIKAAILPLVNKDGLPALAKKIFNDLKYDNHLIYDEKDSIGRRYRRQDAIGTPLCITIDHNSLQDENVTLRFRDSMKQKRVSIKILNELIKYETGMKEVLKLI